MTLAVLSIDLEARLAKLAASMEGAVRLAEKNAGEIASAYDGARNVLGSLGGALAASFSVGAITGFIRKTVDGIDALNDFADAVGTSVENASALEDAALRTGTALETVESAALKLNNVLADAKPGSDQVKLLKAIGLSAEELRRQDPAQALLQVAQALQAVDDKSQAAVVLQLFGKQAREVAPFLKDLATQGRLVATVTTEQAAAAEKFNQQLAALSKNATDAGRSLIGELLPSLNEALVRLREMSKGPGLLAASLEVLKGNSFKDPADGLKYYNDELVKLDARITALREDKRPLVAAFGGDRIKELQAQRVELEKLATFYRNVLNTGNAGGGRGSVSPLDQEKKSVNVAGLLTDAPKEKRRTYDFPVDAGMTSALRALEQTDTAKLAELEARLTSLFTLQRETRGAPAVVEAIRATREELNKLNADPLGDFAAGLDQRAMDRVLDTISRSRGAQVDSLAARTDELATAFRNGRISADDFARGAQVLGDAWAALDEKTKGTADLATELGLSFSSAFEDAIVKGSSLKDLLGSLQQDLMRILTRQLVTQPLANGVGGFLEGLFGGGSGGGGGAAGIGASAADFVKGLFAGWFADGGYIPPGRWGMAGERGPEPVFGGRTGATVVPHSGGPVTINYVMPAGGISTASQKQIAADTARLLSIANRRGN